jgi:1,2-diacylglycerol 3-beta-galactosyltransferase
MTTRVLIVMSDTGGGHRASAVALQEAFVAQHGDHVAVDIVDLWVEHAPWPLNQVPKSYRFLTEDIPWFFAGAYRLGERRGVMRPLMATVSAWIDRRLMRTVESHQPALIISVHPLLQEAPLRVLARHGLTLPWVTVVTDLGSIHPTWFHPAAMLCFVPTAAAYGQAVQAGLQPSRVHVSGLPIRQAFAQPPGSQKALRRALGLQPEAPTVLLMGGGEGVGPLRAIAEAIATQLAGADQGQLVVICGRNDRLRTELAGLPWPAPTHIRGFVDNMAHWMAASDCIVTKAGPGAIAEAMASGLPLVLSGYIPGQETGNVDYVVRNGLGVYCPDPPEIANVVRQWLGPQRTVRERMAQQARQMSRPRAAGQIVDQIVAAALVGPANLP